jgi:hypothetical protein
MRRYTRKQSDSSHSSWQSSQPSRHRRRQRAVDQPAAADDNTRRRRLGMECRPRQRHGNGLRVHHYRKVRGRFLAGDFNLDGGPDEAWVVADNCTIWQAWPCIGGGDITTATYRTTVTRWSMWREH